MKGTPASLCKPCSGCHGMRLSTTVTCSCAPKYFALTQVPCNNILIKHYYSRLNCVRGNGQLWNSVPNVTASRVLHFDKDSSSLRVMLFDSRSQGLLLPPAVAALGRGTAAAPQRRLEPGTEGVPAGLLAAVGHGFSAEAAVTFHNICYRIVERHLMLSNNR